jgi:hypothetical protein
MFWRSRTTIKYRRVGPLRDNNGFNLIEILPFNKAPNYISASLRQFRSWKWIDILELLYVPFSKLLYKNMISFQCHWCIHLLPRSLIRPFQSFQSEPPSKSSPMKQGTKQTVVVRAAPRRRKAYIKRCVAWIGKGCTMVLRYNFKVLGLITIFIISNKNLKQ